MDGPVLLKAFLDANEETARDFVNRSKGRLSESDLSRYLNDGRTPGYDKRVAIAELTHGKVPEPSWSKKRTRKRRNGTRPLAA